jgi:septum site-determining protein MinC
VEAGTQTKTDTATVFEIKSGQFTLPTLHLRSGEMDYLDEQLLARVKQAPDFFRHTPVVIDLSAIAAQGAEVDFPLLIGLMRGYGMFPVAIQGGSAQHLEMAECLELAVLANHRPAPSVKPAQDTQQSKEIRLGPSYAKLVTNPIRSGQRVYAAGRDLIVLASVSSGAEVIADGNIHIYGALRGRALAGVKGNQTARIFCQKLHAELVAIAGHYRVSEQMEAQQLGNAAQVYLAEKKLIVESH